MNGRKPRKSLEDLKEERRRERWKAFMTPLITLTSLVGSVAMLMALIKSCGERSPQAPTIMPRPPVSQPR